MRLPLRGLLAVGVVLAAAACTHSGPAVAQTPEQVSRVLPGATSSMGYVARLPPGYSAASKRTYPTIVFLHGYGERGDGSSKGLDLLESTGLPQLVAEHRLPGAAQPFLILMPQTDDEAWDMTTLRSWLAAVLLRYRVDRSRTYLTGLSMGGGGAVNYLATYGQAGGFAAVVPIAENWDPPPVPLGLPNCATMAATPIWAFHGDLDPTVSKQVSENLVAYLNGHCQEREKAKLTIFLSTFHNAWDRTYDLTGMDPGAWAPDSDPYATDIYTWMLAHRRDDRL